MTHNEHPNLSQDESLEVIRPVKEVMEDELLQRPGVVGVDIGYKRVGGRVTDELAIRLLVEKKRDVPVDQRMPQIIEDIKTDVMQVGRIIPAQIPDTNRYNPLVGGCSVGTCGVPPGGTLGMLVRDRNSGIVMALSCWHVLAAGSGGGPFSVAQPGPLDGGNCPADIFGQLSRSAINEFVDCAVVTVDTAARNFAAQIQGIGFYTGPATTQINNRVVKRGKTTGLTYGDVDGLDASITYEFAGVSYTFKQQITITRAAGVNDVFALPGDSGSVVVGWPNYRNEVVGLVFATSINYVFYGDGAFAWANPISAVLDALDVDMLRPPKGKESKDKEKEREKDGLDLLDVAGIMKEKERDSLDSYSAFQQKVHTESRLFSELELPSSVTAPQPRLAGPLEERLARLEASVNELRHFISRTDRPNLNAGAFEDDTDDRDDPSDNGTQQRNNG
jgi:hypothetical protein